MLSHGKTGPLCLYNEGSQAFFTKQLICLGYHNYKISKVTVCDELLFSVENPKTIFFFGYGVDTCGVGTGVWFSQGKSTEHIARNSRLQIFFFLFLITGNEEQKEKYLKPAIAGDMFGAFALTEPNAGSDAAGIDTIAEEKDGFWVLNGKKQFITNGDFADFVVVIAQTDKLLGEKGLTAFIVETKWSGFSVGKHEDKTGLRASHTVQLFLDNVKVPKEKVEI